MILMWFFGLLAGYAWFSDSDKIHELEDKIHELELKLKETETILNCKGISE